MLRVGKYNWKTKEMPVIDGFTNILIHTTGPLSPYTMKDKNGAIMENWWQFHKIWRRVYKIKQPISRFCKNTRWEWKDEIHFEDNQPTDAYEKWREAGLTHKIWVRYPNGFHHHKECIGSL